MLTDRHLDLIENFDRLPPSAVLPIPVAGAVLGLSPKTVRSLFRLINISAFRRGVLKADVVEHLERAVA